MAKTVSISLSETWVVGEYPTAQLRLCDCGADVSPVLQQRWEVKQYVNDKCTGIRVEWRDVPVIRKHFPQRHED